MLGESTNLGTVLVEQEGRGQHEQGEELWEQSVSARGVSSSYHATYTQKRASPVYTELLVHRVCEERESLKVICECQ